MSRRTRAWANGPFGGGTGGASVGSTTPAALGVASAGASAQAARADHVHAMPSASDVGAPPADAQYLTLAASSGLSAERILGAPHGSYVEDPGTGQTARFHPLGSSWEYEYNPQAAVMTMVGGGNDSGTLTSVTDHYVAGAGPGASISSTNNAVWFGVNAASDKGGFIQPMRGYIVITTLAAVDELRGYFGCWSSSLSSVGDSPGNGDGWAVSVRDSDLELISRDGTTLSARTKLVDLATTTTYWIEYYYQPGVSIAARVLTASAGVVTYGAWVTHSSNLPRTSQPWSIIGCWAPTAANSRGLTWHRSTGWDVLV